MVAPLTSRRLDLLYFIYFLTHVPASALVDFQYIYPDVCVPQFLRAFLGWYVKLSNDRMMAVALGHGSPREFAWFKTFVYLEFFFQLPVFFLGMRAMWKGSRDIYILLLIYGASTATTTLPCLTQILSSPVASSPTWAPNTSANTVEQLCILLACYTPYLLIPLIMTFDMASRIGRLVNMGMRAEEREKLK